MASSKFAGLAEITRNSGAAKKLGRPKSGMRSNPDFRQFSFFVRKETSHRVLAALHEKRDGTTASGLLNELLEKWLEDQQKSGRHA